MPEQKNKANYVDCQCGFCGNPLRKRDWEVRRSSNVFCNRVCMGRANGAHAVLARTRESVESRFWGKVHKTPECWLWTGGHFADGYGAIRHNNKPTGTHRLSWEMHNGPIPNGLCVLHHCDNPPCVRPDHLFLGTKKDNAVDMGQKGRNYFPEDFGARNRKLDETKIRSIRASCDSPAALAQEHGVSRRTISKVLNRETWSHVV